MTASTSAIWQHAALVLGLFAEERFLPELFFSFLFSLGPHLLLPAQYCSVQHVSGWVVGWRMGYVCVCGGGG